MVAARAISRVEAAARTPAEVLAKAVLAALEAKPEERPARAGTAAKVALERRPSFR